MIQGTASGVLKIGLRRLYDQVEPAWCQIMLTAHDEYDMLVRNDMLPFMCNEVLPPLLEGVLPIKLEIEIEVGPNWADLKPWEG